MFKNFAIPQAGALEADSTDDERSCQHKNGQMENICLEGKDGWKEYANVRRKPMGIKSFSHELGSKGRTQPVHPRAHSYDDLKVCLHFFLNFFFLHYFNIVFLIVRLLLMEFIVCTVFTTYISCISIFLLH